MDEDTPTSPQYQAFSCEVLTRPTYCFPIKDPDNRISIEEFKAWFRLQIINGEIGKNIELVNVIEVDP